MRCWTMAFFAGLLMSHSALAEGAADLSQKLQPYIECINAISGRAMDSQERYENWAGKTDKLNTKAKVVLGLYDINDPADCAKGVEEANKAEPHNGDLETAGTAFAKAATTLAPLLQTANTYYDQNDYKDDKFAKGIALHPQILAAFKDFDKADEDLRAVVQKLGDEAQIARLADIEKSEGKNGHYLTEVLMIKAKAVIRLEADVPQKDVNVASSTEAITALETAIKDLEDYAKAHSDERIDSSLASNGRSVLTSAKNLMRRVRDKVPFNEGDKMILSQPNAGWMVEGSQPRLVHDYNELVDTYNRHM